MKDNDIFLEIQYDGRRHLGFLKQVNLARSATMAVCLLSCVPNLVNYII